MKEVLTAPAKLWYLSRVNLFADLTPDELNAINAAAQSLRFQRGEAIFLRGDPADALFVLKEGTVKLSCVTEDGRELTLALISPKDVFGMLPLFGSAVQTYDAVALSEVLVCRVSAGALEDLIRRNPRIALKFLRTLGEQLREYQGALEVAYTKSAKERLALVLVKLAEQHGLRARLGVRINLRVTHQELANMIGVARETTSALMSELRHDGVIAYDHQHIVICDLPRLRRLARL